MASDFSSKKNQAKNTDMPAARNKNEDKAKEDKHQENQGGSVLEIKRKVDGVNTERNAEVEPSSLVSVVNGYVDESDIPSSITIDKPKGYSKLRRGCGCCGSKNGRATRCETSSVSLVKE